MLADLPAPLLTLSKLASLNPPLFSIFATLYRLFVSIRESRSTPRKVKRPRNRPISLLAQEQRNLLPKNPSPRQ